MQLHAHLVSAMPDVSLLSGEGADASINIKESRELDYWVQTLRVSEEQLRMAVAAVGVQVEDVRNHFGVLRTSA